MTASKDSILQSWASFLGTLADKRVFILDLWHFTTAYGINDFVSLLQANHVTPIVITRVSEQPNFGDLLGFDRYPTDLPAFNIEPGSDITGGELVNLALGAGFDIAGCAGDFDLDDYSLAEATLVNAHAPAYAYRDRPSMSRLPAGLNIWEIKHFNRARFRLAFRLATDGVKQQQQENPPSTPEREAQQRMRDSQAL